MVDRPSSFVSGVFAAPLTTPLPINDQDPFLDPPRASFLASETSSSPSTPASNNSTNLLPAVNKSEPDEFPEEHNNRGLPQSQTKRRPTLLWASGIAILVLVILAVILPVYFTVIKPKPKGRNNAATSSGSGSPTGSPTGTGGGSTADPKNPTSAITGGDGSTVIAEDGSNFIYSNRFGGYWVSDPNAPFNDDARPNSWTPPLNQSWTWGKDRVFGVNLGGLFVLEPFISPALYQKYPGASDEWSLSQLMAADTASGGLNQLEEHYKTFITEKDIAEIAGAGLNWIRVPIPFWAIDTWPGEPFLAKTSWKYILRLLSWARKYGIRVNLDLHTIPGSQNGYNHSGKGGQVNFLNGIMGIANSQRALNYIRIITEFISQPEYKAVVPMFSIMNEALLGTIGRSQLTSFYLEAHNMIRSITGYGEGNGPYIAIHDGFGGLDTWANFLSGSDRIAMDTHPYFAFDGSSATSPIDTGTGANAGGVWPQQACSSWGSGINASRSAFGVTIAGEFSNGFNDCGLFLRGVSGASNYGGNCADWQDSSNWTPGTKAGLMQFALASMDSLQDFFFWTWKIGNSTAGKVESPLWSYQLGLQNGWMPTDPRSASGTCVSLGAAQQPFGGIFQPWQTGGPGAGTIVASSTLQFPWPPASISGAGGVLANRLPSYTPTGTVATLPPPTLTATGTKSIGINGWYNSQDTASAPTPIAGCTYPDPWNAIDAAVPPRCGGGDIGTPVITALPGGVTNNVRRLLL